MDAGLPKARVRLQLEGRIRSWVRAHPEYRGAVLTWLAQFRADPFDPELAPLQRPDQHGQRVFEYHVEGAPLAVVVVIQRYEDLGGFLNAREIFPASPDDIVPDH